MTGFAALIPFKATGAKSRLSGMLSEEARREFAELMLGDLLSAFDSAGQLARCFVISSDRRALSFARSSGAGAVPQPTDLGVNSAISLGMRRLENIDEFMVVPADLPALTRDELKLALSIHSQGLAVVIAPSRHFDGTNLLIFSRAGRIRLSYDKNSFWNHVASAGRGGLSLAVCCGPGLTLDVDSIADFKALARLKINRASVAFAKKEQARWAS